MGGFHGGARMGGFHGAAPRAGGRRLGRPPLRRLGRRTRLALRLRLWPASRLWLGARLRLARRVSRRGSGRRLWLSLLWRWILRGLTGILTIAAGGTGASPPTASRRGAWPTDTRTDTSPPSTAILMAMAGRAIGTAIGYRRYGWGGWRGGYGRWAGWRGGYRRWAGGWHGGYRHFAGGWHGGYRHFAGGWHGGFGGAHVAGMGGHFGGAHMARIGGHFGGGHFRH